LVTIKLELVLLGIIL